MPIQNLHQSAENAEFFLLPKRDATYDFKVTFKFSYRINKLKRTTNSHITSQFNMYHNSLAKLRLLNLYLNIFGVSNSYKEYACLFLPQAFQGYGKYLSQVIKYTFYIQYMKYNIPSYLTELKWNFVLHKNFMKFCQDWCSA